MKIPRGCLVVECSDMQLAGNDLIRVEMEKDFVWLVGSSSHVFKMKNTYYLIGDITFVYVDKDKK